MLAKPFDAKRIQFPIYIQPKLDGMRAVWTGKVLLSRTGKLIKGVPELVKYLEKHYPDFPLDGELYKHGQDFEDQISTLRRTVNIQENLEMQYNVYDLPIPHMTFQKRWELLLSRVQETDRIKIVQTLWFEQLIDTNDNLVKIQETFEAMGYEGAMLRNGYGVYRFGKRSDDLLKLKSTQDQEFLVLDVYQLTRKEKIIVPANTPGAHQYADGTWYKDGAETPDLMAGGLLLQTADGKTFECGTGYSEALRREFWQNPPIGKLATIKFQELTADGIPRFPVFKTIRDYE